MAASAQYRDEEAQELWGEAGLASEQAGDMEYASRCRTDQAISFIHLKRYELALVVSEKAIQLDRTYWRGWAERGVALDWLERWDEAVDSCQKALDSNPPAKKVADIQSGLEFVMSRPRRSAGS